jgi:outer membrane protein assembly factor BamB
MKTSAGESLPPVSFDFSVSVTDPRAEPPLGIAQLFPDLPWTALPPEPVQAPTGVPTLSRMTSLAPQATDALPPSYPGTILYTSNAPGPGAVFLAPISLRGEISCLMILDNAGLPLFYRDFARGGGAFDFKMQPNGRLTYIAGSGVYYALDSTYAVVDSFSMGNGYTTDLHDCQWLPDGHVLLMAYDTQRVDMSAIVPGGDPNAYVIGLVLQEIDEAKNVVFQWRSWDHFAITDAAPGISLTAVTIDYVHGNAIELDHDGNLLLSARNMSEITKIDRQTGEIIWRLGLHAANNQFTFVNDTRGFSFQHDIRRLPNGHITLFDNGNTLTPLYSRAVEYELDEVNKVATQVWEYRTTPDVYAGFMGNVQRLESGNTMIGWGGSFSNPKLTEVYANGTKAFELGLLDSTSSFTYRAFRHPWRTTRFVTSLSSLVFASVEMGRSGRLELSVRNTSNEDVTLNGFVTTDPAFAVPNAAPVTLPPGGSTNVVVVFTPTSMGVRTATLYIRQVSDHELVAQDIPLWGRGKGLGRGALAPKAAARPLELRFSLAGARPNPFSRTTAIAFELPRDGRVRLAVLDVHGRLVETLVDEARAAGSYTVSWTPKARANGIFFCRLESGSDVAVKKLAVME